MLMKLIILTLSDRLFTDSIALCHLRSGSDMTNCSLLLSAVSVCRSAIISVFSP